MLKFKQNKGITLIALVITIIVLIILAGVAISVIGGENGIVTKALKASKDYNEGSAKEALEVMMRYYSLKKNTEGNLSFENYLLANGADNVEQEGENYIVDIGGYSFTINKNNLSIVATQEAVARPEVSNITLGANGTTGIADHSLNPGQSITINFDTNLEGGEITNVVPALPYTTDGTETNVTFTINGVIDGKQTSKLITVNLSDKYKADIVINLSKETVTKDSITASVNWEGIPDSFTKEISINNGVSYEPYTGDKVIDKNCTIIAKASNGSVEYTSEPKIVDFIDKLEPNAFNVGISDTISSTTLRITASTTDKTDTSRANTTSGLAGYIYYVYQGDTQVAKSNLINAEQYDATGLIVGTTYTIYAEAYDVAGNKIRSANTETCTKLGLYTWEKYVAVSGKVYTYELTGTSSGFLDKGSKFVTINTLDEGFDTTTGKWISSKFFTISSGSVGKFIVSNSNRPEYGTSIPNNGASYVHKITSVEEFSSYSYIVRCDLYSTKQIDGYIKGSFIENITSTNSDEYPTNGAKNVDGVTYWFVKK